MTSAPSTTFGQFTVAATYIEQRNAVQSIEVAGFQDVIQDRKIDRAGKEQCKGSTCIIRNDNKIKNEILLLQRCIV